MARKDEDRFPPSNGRLVGGFGLAIAAASAVLVLVNGFQRQDFVALPLLALFAYVVWVAVLQTHLQVEGSDLELHNSFHVTRVPLASVKEVEVRMALLVRLVEGGRLTFAAISRSRREIAKNAPSDPMTNYPDLVEDRLMHLAGEARELGREPGPVVREPAVLRIAVAVILLALVVVGFLLV